MVINMFVIENIVLKGKKIYIYKLCIRLLIVYFIFYFNNEFFLYLMIKIFFV